MKANEITIGDWVHCITDNTYVRVEEISICDNAAVLGRSYYRADGGKYNILSDIDGIPLTRQILEKNWFKIDDNGIAHWKSMDSDAVIII